MTNDSQVMKIALAEARLHGDNFVDSGHLLMGVIGDGPGLASYLLGCSGVTLQAVRNELKKITPVANKRFTGELPYAPGVSIAIAKSWEQCRMLGKSSITTEHILLGILALDEGMSSTIFEQLNVDVQALRARIIAALSLGERPSSK